MSTDQPRHAVLKWSCLTLAVLFAAGLGWVLNDLRIAIKSSMQTLDENLPDILANTKKSSATLAVLAEDIKQLRDLAGAAGGDRDRSLVVYADRLLDLIEESGGQIGLQKKAFGSGLKELLPASEWVVAARKEGLWLSFRAKSKRELLDRLTKTKFGSAWYIQIENAEPMSLADWLGQQNVETAEIQRQEEDASQQ